MSLKLKIFLSLIGLSAVTSLVITKPFADQKDAGVVINPEKFVFKSSKAEQAQYHGKAHAPVQLEIQKAEAGEIEPGVPFELTVRVRSNHLLENALVKWVLPQGAELVRGPIEQQINQLPPGQVHKSTIMVVIPTLDQNFQFSSMASFQQGANRMGSSTQFNTRLDLVEKEQGIEASRRALLKKRAEQTGGIETQSAGNPFKFYQ